MLSEFKVLLTIIALGAAAPISVSQEQSTLKETFKDTFLIGAAINRNQIYAKDAGEDSLIKAQFNSITPENVLKWESVHPKPGTYDFAAPDAYVAFGQKNHMYIVGHALLWHHQTPKWVFQDENGIPLSRDALLQRMHDHIRTVVGRYKGRINSWDVGQRSARGRWLSAAIAVAEDYRRGLHRKGVRVCPRNRSERAAELQRVRAGEPG
jgi:endo-1,4-beta-xylanase